MILHMRGGDMCIKVFLAHPLFTKDKQPLVKDIRMEFVPGASWLCPDKRNDLINLLNKIPVMLRVNPASG
jgi:hypothetical protein